MKYPGVTDSPRIADSEKDKKYLVKVKISKLANSRINSCLTQVTSPHILT